MAKEFSGQPASHQLPDFLVVSAMALVAAAFGAALYSQVGLALWLAGAVAVAIFATLTGVHSAARRGRLRPAWPEDGSGRTRTASRAEAKTPRAGHRPGRGSSPRPRRNEPQWASLPVEAAQGASSPWLPRGFADPGVPAVAVCPPEPAMPAGAQVHRYAQNEPRVAEALREYWAQRPAKAADVRSAVSEPVPPPIPPVTDVAIYASAPEAPARAGMPHGQHAGSADVRPAVGEAEVEVVQGHVKRLADQLNAAETRGAADNAAREANMDGVIEASLEALRSTAMTMRSAAEGGAVPFAPEAPQAAARAALPPAPALNEPAPQAPAAAPALPEALRPLNDALTAGRTDVLIESVCALADRQVRHYAVTLRVKTSAGDIPAAALDADVHQTPLAALLDGLRLSRAIQLARKLGERGKKGSMLFEATAALLTTERLVADLLAACRQNGGGCQLVPVFPQEDIRHFGNRHWEAVRILRGAGTRFALRGVTHLDISLDALKPWSFELAIADAKAYLSGLPRGGTPTAPADSCRLLASAGLTLVVGGVDDAETLSKLLGSGVQMGHGMVFGGARLVKPEALEAGQTAAA